MAGRLKRKSRKEVLHKVMELFDKAALAFDDDKKAAKEYVRKARRIAMKHKIRLGKLKRRFCRHCYSYLKPGVNSRIRTREGSMIIYCKECRNYTRIRYKK
jgi:ribonuclease P protein subunit RPR2